MQIDMISPHRPESHVATTPALIPPLLTDYSRGVATLLASNRLTELVPVKVAYATSPKEPLTHGKAHQTYDVTASIFCAITEQDPETGDFSCG